MRDGPAHLLGVILHLQAVTSLLAFSLRTDGHSHGWRRCARGQREQGGLSLRPAPGRGLMPTGQCRALAPHRRPKADITAGTEPSHQPARLLLEPTVSLPGAESRGQRRSSSHSCRVERARKRKRDGSDSPLSTTSQTSTFTTSSVAETGEQQDQRPGSACGSKDGPPGCADATLPRAPPPGLLHRQQAQPPGRSFLGGGEQPGRALR